MVIVIAWRVGTSRPRAVLAVTRAYVAPDILEKYEQQIFLAGRQE